MNKQEFQQKIKDMKPPKFFNAITLGEAYKAGFEEAKGNALCYSCFLNEPEKPVVPQYVADMIVEKQLNWIVENQEDFVKAWLYGYEIEKEKLYTVELPNPNAGGHVVLCKTSDGIVSIAFTGMARWQGCKNFQLTEAEIKKDFDWAWEFRKEVEE